MNSKNFFRAGILVFVLSAAVAFKGDKDKLHKRDFTIQITEAKKTKSTEDEMSFKDGKVWCGNTIFDKLSIKYIKYELKVDSTYMDEDIEKEYLEVLATTEMDQAQTFEMKCIIDDYNIEGTMRVLKAEKEKKAFSFTGKEKPKKEKKKKD